MADNSGTAGSTGGENFTGSETATKKDDGMIALMILAGTLAVALIMGAIYWFSSKKQGDAK